MTPEQAGRRPLYLKPLLAASAEAGDLILECDEERVRLHGVPPDTAFRLLGRIDGRRPYEALSANAPDGAPSDPREAALLQALVRAELAGDAAPTSSVTGDEAADRLSAAFAVWNDRLFAHPLWRHLSEGRASKSVVVGWVLETYHFIRGACARLPLAIAHCPAGPQRDALSRHFAEEYDHDALFLKALDALGLPADAVRTAPPLPGTQAVIDFMRQAARDDVLVYAACSGLLESTGSDAARGRRFYDVLEGHYAAMGDFIDPMRRHVALDEGYGHGSVMAELFAANGVLGRERLDRASAGVYAFVGTLEFWFADILEHYGPLSVAAPEPVRRYRPAEPLRSEYGPGSAPEPLRRAADEDAVVPLLSPAATVEARDGVLRVEDANDALTYRDESAALMRRATPHLDGLSALDALAGRVGVSPAALREHLAPLIQAGLALAPAKAAAAAAPAAFADALNEEACFWNRAYFAAPFMQRLFAGRATPSEVLCWGVEFTHFIRGANRYMAAGVAHCDPSSPWLTPLAAHFAEEWGHGEIFLEGLAACGLDRSAVETARPLPETEALLNRFAEIGRRSTIGYAALFAFMRPIQAGAPAREDPELLTRLSERYPFAAGFFDAMARHGGLDEELGHGAAPVFALLREAPALDRKDRLAAVNALRTAAECFTALTAGVSRRCARGGFFHPNRPACFESLPGAP